MIVQFGRLWQVPLLIVVEDNHIAQTTPTEQVLAGSMAGRFAAFGIPCTELDTSDVLEIQAAATAVVNQIRADPLPGLDPAYLPLWPAFQGG